MQIHLKQLSTPNQDGGKGETEKAEEFEISDNFKTESQKKIREKCKTSVDIKVLLG